MRIQYLPLLNEKYQIRVGIMVPVSCCGARQNLRAYALPRFCRPLPLAPLPPPATDGGRVAPRTLTDRSSPPCNKNKGYPVGVSLILAYTTQFDTMQR